MYLVVIGWLYVVVMMSVAEATNTTGTVLGAIVTFVLYGLLPVGLVVYIMRTPQRRKERKAREAQEAQEGQQAKASADDQAQRAATTTNPTELAPVDSGQPDASSHAPGAAEPSSVAPVGKEPG